MPFFMVVSLLHSIDLTSPRTIWFVAVLAVLAAVVAAVLLPRTLSDARGEQCADAPDVAERTTNPGKPGHERPNARAVLRAAGRCTARTVMVIVPVLLVVGVGGLLVNLPMHYVRTLGDVVEAASPQAHNASRIAPLPDASVYDTVPASAWKASFQDVGDGSQKGTWTGPISGITLPVRVVLPADYRPDDGRTYNVIEGIHGWVGDPESLVTGLSSPKALQAAIDSGRIPPSIIVIPSVNVDGNQHDCVDIAGRPAVETWTAEEIPRMIQASFPNVSTQRAGWLLMGVSAGAYCAARTAFDVPQRFGSVGVLSSYNRPTEGALAHSGQQLQAQNALSTLLEQRVPDGLRFYVMGTQDDAYGAASTAWLMEEAAQEPDSVSIDTPPQGGHSWFLWTDRFPAMLTWWGSDPAVFAAAGLPAPEGDAWTKAAAEGIGTLSVTPKDRRTVGSASPIHAAPFEINGLGTIIVAVGVSLAAIAVALVWSPHWGRRRGDKKPSALRLGGAILGRFAVVALAAVLITATAGIGVNIGGGFYTSWHDLWASIRVTDNSSS